MVIQNYKRTKGIGEVLEEVHTCIILGIVKRKGVGGLEIAIFCLYSVQYLCLLRGGSKNF